jgi:transcriptional regulator with XRE-family HTH domain
LAKRTVSASFSSDIVNYLIDRDYSITEIARLLNVSKSFLSRVKSRERSFTVDHLLILERALKRPLPLLLLETIPREEIPDDLVELYEATRTVFETSLPLPSKRRSRLRQANAARAAAVPSTRKKAG